MFAKLFFTLSVVATSLNVWADDSKGKVEIKSMFDVLPARGGMLSNVVIDSQVTTAKVGSYTRLSIHLSCYATNLRSVNNPVAENSMINAFIDVYDSSNTVKTVQVRFPAEFLKPAANRILNGVSAESLVAVDTLGIPNVKIKSYDNVVQLLLPQLKEMTLTSSGEVTNVTEKNLIVSGIRFTQSEAPTGYGGGYFGSVGPLSSQIKWYTSVDGKTIDVYASFPGAAAPGQRAVYEGETRTGFCGAFYSPLMLFFDDELPDFSGSSRFSLHKDQTGKIYWPEANSPGYFLVLDEKNDSKIIDGNQLFGDNEKFENGFANLSSHDLNKDQIIDAKDKVFKKLKLWQDKNGDGIAQASELKRLSQMDVTSISLKFINETKKFGDRAEYKQKSTFQFKKGAVEKKGHVIDIWFSPAPL
jgi:hypothetical protein